MSKIVRKYPALSLLVLAMIFGLAPLVAVDAGLLPKGASQLGALGLLVPQNSIFAFLGSRVPAKLHVSLS